MTLLSGLGNCVDVEKGLVTSQIHFDEEVYKQETERIFGRSWLVVGHEGMVPENGNFVTNYMGEVPVIVSRDATGKVNVLINRCSHRGNQVCLFDRGKTRSFECSYHGWSYGLDGGLKGVPFEEGAYPGGLDKTGLGLQKATRVESFHGLLFATFDPSPPDLRTWLGEDVCWVLQNYILSVPVGGLELLPGIHRYESPGNWKLGSENFIGDNYHFYTATHVSFMAALQEAAERGVVNSLTTLPAGEGATVYEGVVGAAGSVPLGLGMVTMDPLVYEGDLKDAARLGPDAVEWVRHRWDRMQKVLVGHETKMYAFVNGGLFPNLGLMGFFGALYGRHFMQFHPRGVRSHEIWQWTMVEKEAPDSVKEIAAERVYQGQHMAGLIAPDDVENFERMLDAGQSPHTWDRQFHYGIQFHEEPTIPSDIPIQLRATPNEINQRRFYAYWLDQMGRA